MGETGGKRCAVTRALILGLFFGAAFCDQNCDNAMKKFSNELADSVKSTNLVVCSELTQIKCTEEYAPSLLEKRPTVLFDAGSSCKYATIMFFGKIPDFNQTKLLWLEYDVPTTDLKNGFHGQSGNERVIYTKPKISAGTSNYFFFVYCQKGVIQNFDCCTTDERQNINVKAFAKKNNLGDVAAAIYFDVTADGQLMDKEPQKDGVCRMQ